MIIIIAERSNKLAFSLFTIRIIQNSDDLLRQTLIDQSEEDAGRLNAFSM
jgi:hypothetical protein